MMELSTDYTDYTDCRGEKHKVGRQRPASPGGWRQYKSRENESARRHHVSSDSFSRLLLLAPAAEGRGRPTFDIREIGEIRGEPYQPTAWPSLR
jgi:hypothetical protein